MLEHELNHNTWHGPSSDVLFAGTYTVPNETWTVVLRLHVATCDRTTVNSLLKCLLVLLEEKEEEGDENIEGRNNKLGKASLAIKDLVPCGKAKKVCGQEVLTCLVTL